MRRPADRWTPAAWHAVKLRQRQSLVAVALAIADVEDQLAVTFDRMAAAWPHRATGLTEKAAEARHVAVVEREHALRYGQSAPPPQAGRGVSPPARARRGTRAGPAG